MEFRKIVYFIKAAQCKNFSQASRELFISPQTLSKQIKELETSLGYRLFVRNTVRVELTDRGREVYARFAELKDAWEKAWLQSVEKTKIQFGFFAGLSENDLLEGLLTHMTETYKEWDVQILAMDIPQIIESILNGDLDLAMTAMYDGEHYKGICMKELLISGARVYMPASHPLAEKEEISLQDVLDTSCILVDNNREQPGSIFDTIRKNGHPVFVRDNLSLAQTIQIRNAVALLPETEELEKRKGIVSKPLDPSNSFHFGICLVFKEGHPLRDKFEKLDTELNTANRTMR